MNDCHDIWSMLASWELANQSDLHTCSLCNDRGVYWITSDDDDPAKSVMAFCDCAAATMMPTRLRIGLTACAEIVTP